MHCPNQTNLLPIKNWELKLPRLNLLNHKHDVHIDSFCILNHKVNINQRNRIIKPFCLWLLCFNWILDCLFIVVILIIDFAECNICDREKCTVINDKKASGTFGHKFLMFSYARSVFFVECMCRIYIFIMLCYDAYVD